MSCLTGYHHTTEAYLTSGQDSSRSVHRIPILEISDIIKTSATTRLFWSFDKIGKLKHRANGKLT